MLGQVAQTVDGYCARGVLEEAAAVSDSTAAEFLDFVREAHDFESDTHIDFTLGHLLEEIHSRHN